MSHKTLFTHLKIILLQYFQFFMMSGLHLNFWLIICKGSLASMDVFFLVNHGNSIKLGINRS